MEILLTIFLVFGIIFFALQIYQHFSRPIKVEHIIKFPVQPQSEQVQNDADNFWEGPAPTLEERRQALHRLTEFFKQFPESPLKESYPQQANMAIALKRYHELEQLLQYGQITQESYDEEVEKLLPLIDISEDLKD